MIIPTKKENLAKGWLYSIVLFSFSFVLPLNADPVKPPNPDVEAATARALLENGIKLHNRGSSKQTHSNLEINGLPYVLSRLGRTKAALKITYWKQIDSPKSERDEVLRVSVRRSAILGDIARAASLVPKIKNRYCKVDALLTLARAYIRKRDLKSARKDEIAVGQKTQAFANIKYLEKSFDRKLDSKNPFITSGLLGIAKLWRKLGNQKELDAFLKDFFNHKQNDYSFTKQDHMRILMANGFVSEVEKVFNSFPKSERDSMKSFSADIKYQIAISNVNKFPSAILISDDPAMTVSGLISYVNKLTEQIFDVPSGKQFEINSCGFVISQGYATNQNVG